MIPLKWSFDRLYLIPLISEAFHILNYHLVLYRRVWALFFLRKKVCLWYRYNLNPLCYHILHELKNFKFSCILMHVNPVYQTIENWIEVGKEMDLISHIVWGGGGILCLIRSLIGKKCLVIDQWDWSYCGGSGVQVSLWPLGEDLLCVGDSTADLTISVSALWQMWNSEN